MKNTLLLLFILFSFTKLIAQQLKSIPGPVGYGTNQNTDDRTLIPFFKDKSFIYCSTFKVISTNPIVKRGYVVKVDISNGSQYICSGDYLPAKAGFNAKKINDLIVFSTGSSLAKININTDMVAVISSDADRFDVFEHHVIYENYNDSGLYVVDLNTNTSTQLYSPNNRKFYRLGATYYDNGILYFRSQYITMGVYYGIYKYNPVTKSLTEIVGRNVVSGSEIYQDRDEIAKVNDNVVFLMKDSDYILKYFSVNLTSQTLNPSFTFTNNSVYDSAVNDLMVFNNLLYLTSQGKVYISDGAASPQLTNYPPFVGYGSADYSGEIKYLNNEAYLPLYISEYGYEIWKYDGTDKDKQLVKDITPGSEGSFATNKNGFINNNKLYYTVNGGPLAFSLYETDGTPERTVCLVDHFTYLSFSDLFFENDTIYFYGKSDANNGLCVYTPAATITPDFTQVSAICTGDDLIPLPKVSNNGISGTWSPELDNTITTEYTFTPISGQSASIAKMTIVVNDKVTPTFEQVAPICSGSALSALPTISTNGISGEWSPALNNTTTTEYTFIPSDRQCSTTATMTIVVNDKVTPTFEQVAPICFGSAVSALPTISANGISGVWSPALNNTTTTEYTFIPSDGQCSTTATMTIVVNDKVTPTFEQVAPICSGSAVSALPTISTNGVSGVWSPALNNTTTTEYTFKPSNGQCSTTATMTIVVNDKVTPTFEQVAPICSGSAVSALPIISTNGVSGIWSPALNNTTSTEYTFIPSDGQCSTTATMTIVVNDKVTPIFKQVDPICSGSALSALPTISANGISGVWSPALNNTSTAEYTFIPSDGQCSSTNAMTIVVNQNPLTPSADSQQKLGFGDTVEDLKAIGDNLKWYLSENSPTPLALDKVLTENTYYVSQTVNTCESKRNAVLVTLTTLGTDNFSDIQFNIKGFPNPFADTFRVEINIETQEIVKILIYNTLGGLIESKEGTPSELSHYVFGKNYAVGIYNIIINQSGKKINAFRMIKS